MLYLPRYRLIQRQYNGFPSGESEEVGKVKQNVKIPTEATKLINEILSRGNDVIIKYRENKGEAVILEQKVSSKKEFKILSE